MLAATGVRRPSTVPSGDMTHAWTASGSTQNASIVDWSRAAIAVISICDMAGTVTTLGRFGSRAEGVPPAPAALRNVNTLAADGGDAADGAPAAPAPAPAGSTAAAVTRARLS